MLCLSASITGAHGNIPPLRILLCLWKQSVGGDRAATQAVKESPLVSWSKRTKNPRPMCGKRANSYSPRVNWGLGGSCFPQPSFAAPAALNPSTAMNENLVSPSQVKCAKSHKIPVQRGSGTPARP